MQKFYKRRLVRERVLQVLYAYEMNRESLQALIDGTLSDITDKADIDFANSLINKVLAEKKEFDELISGKVNNWEMSRIALIDKILLRMGICEIIYFQDIPPKVSINEVIEIAKNYSTGGSGKFINGILDAVLSDTKKSGKLKKAGRGLLEESIKPSNKKQDE